MDMLLLSYKEPKLLTYSLPQGKKWWKKIFDYLFLPIVIVCSLFSGIFVIDSIDSKFTNSVMNAVYSVGRFFAPDLPLFEDESRFGFVSKMFNIDYKYITKYDKINHIVVYDDFVEEAGIIQYKISRSGTLRAPANCIVKSVDVLVGNTIVMLALDNKTVMVIESNANFGVTAGSYLKSGHMMGTHTADQKVSVSFYIKGKLVKSPSSEIRWANAE